MDYCLASICFSSPGCESREPPCLTTWAWLWGLLWLKGYGWCDASWGLKHIVLFGLLCARDPCRDFPHSLGLGMNTCGWTCTQPAAWSPSTHLIPAKPVSPGSREHGSARRLPWASELGVFLYTALLRPLLTNTAMLGLSLLSDVQMHVYWVGMGGSCMYLQLKAGQAGCAEMRDGGMWIRGWDHQGRKFIGRQELDSEAYDVGKMRGTQQKRPCRGSRWVMGKRDTWVCILKEGISSWRKA